MSGQVAVVRPMKVSGRLRRVVVFSSAKRVVDVGSRHSSMTGESQGKVEAGRSTLLSKRGVDVGSRHSSLTLNVRERSE